MQLYYCETCGLKISNDEIVSGAAVLKSENKYCCQKCNRGSPSASSRKSTPAGNRILVKPAAALKPSESGRKLAAVKVEPAEAARTGTRRSVGRRPRTPEENTQTTMMIGGAAGVVVLLIASVMAFSGGKSSEKAALAADRTADENAARPGNSDRPPAPPPPVAGTGAGVAKPPAGLGLLASMDKTREDPIEAEGQMRLKELRASRTMGMKADEFRRRCEELTSGVYASTDAGREARMLLQGMPGATVCTPKPGVWWEAENTTETNFVSHVWLNEQLEQPQNLSGGHWLNALVDSKAAPTAAALFAKYKVDVPCDGKYNLWAREFYRAGTPDWRYRWDDGEWHTAPHTQKGWNQVKLGKDRDVVWCDYGPQVLTKGSHVFTLEVPKPGLEGFDCFYLSAREFHPDGNKRP